MPIADRIPLFGNLFAVILVTVLLVGNHAVNAQDRIELLRTFSIPGNQLDRSGLASELQPGVWHDVFGGISALEYTGQGDRYIALPDRGPLDGAVDWTCRFHFVNIPIESGTVSSFAIEQTILLADGARKFSGLSTRFESTEDYDARLDPEGVRIANDGALFLSDEYGPHLLKFGLDGLLQHRLQVPNHYKIATPGKSKADENSQNQSGRQGNRGMEGLAISRNGQRLFGLMQSPLLQDCRRTAKGKPRGNFCRLIEFPIDGSRPREFAYRLDNPKYKLNEILAIGAGKFLVIERDGEAGSQARFRRIVQINVAAATDVADLDRLPDDELPARVMPVAKTTFLDFMDPSFGLAGQMMPEKIEGLTFGPKLSDGRWTLLVASDNDFKTDQATQIWCFAIDEPMKESQVTTR